MAAVAAAVRVGEPVAAKLAARAEMVGEVDSLQAEQEGAAGGAAAPAARVVIEVIELVPVETAEWKV